MSLRAVLRARRRALSKEYQMQSAQAVLESFKATFLYAVHNIALYMADENEVDLFPLAALAQNLGKSVFFPVMRRSPDLGLLFYRNVSVWKKNSFGIVEPDITAQTAVSPREMDIILVPLVAFDNYGNRLGRGAGYYDRALSQVKVAAPLQRVPAIVGLAYSFQEVEALEAQSWDVPLDCIITEKDIHYCASCRQDTSR